MEHTIEYFICKIWLKCFTKIMPKMNNFVDIALKISDKKAFMLEVFK